MGISTIELSGTDLVEGFAFSQMGSYSYAELVARFGVEKANLIMNDIAGYGPSTGSGYGLYVDIENLHGSPYITTNSAAFGGAPESVISTTDTALELAQSTSTTATESEVLYSAQGALKTGTGTAKAASLMTLDVGIVGAAIAPLLGVSLGNELYQNNPEFWTKLSMKLLPFCYPGTTEIPAWLDIVESALVPGTYEAHGVIDKAIYDTIKSWFEEEGYGNTREEYIVIDETGVVDPLIWREVYDGINLGNNVILRQTSGSGTAHVAHALVHEGMAVVYCASDTPCSFAYYYTSTQGWGVGFSAGFEYTKDGETCYVGVVYPTGSYVEDLLSLVPRSASQTLDRYDVCWSLMFGETSPAGTYPEGTSAWEGDEAPDAAYEKLLLYVDDLRNEIVERAGMEIRIDKVPDDDEPEIEPQEKPDNWPEGLTWPIEVDFPWKKPDDYTGDWPEKMPWPLPPERPDWWPSILPYPNRFPKPEESPDPQLEPDPQKNPDPSKPARWVKQTKPGAEIDPKKDPTPDPIDDPSKKGTGIKKPTRPSPDLPNNKPIRHKKSSGTTPVPPVPSIPLPFSSTDGLISVYNPTDAELKSFAHWLWVTYADPSIEKLWNNPFDGVIGLMELYCTPPVNGSKTIRSGFLDSQISSATIDRYTEINCGSITVPEFYGDYLDYSPYSKCYCYLPFIGIVELNVDDIVGHAVNISYKIDCYNGSCIAQITVAKSTIVNGERVDYSNTAYQFSGNCGVELPLSGGSQASIRAGMIQAAAYGLSSVIGGIASGASGNIGGAISQLGYGAANAIGSLVSAKSSVQHSGSFGSSFGALGIKTPYIIVTRPKEIEVVNYNELYGYPAHSMVTIGACSGFLRVREVNVKSATANNEEKAKIESLLKEGVYV